MKKLIFILISITGIIYCANAQTERGKFMLGGEISFDKTSQKDSKNSLETLKLKPSLGYFISNNVAVGLGLFYENKKNSYVFEMIMMNKPEPMEVQVKIWH